MARFTMSMQLRLLAVLTATIAWSLVAIADDDHHHHEAAEQLGTVSFPTSCESGVKAPFERGVALLYSFEYEDAEKAFQQVAAKDPQCAMAYWGQAMSLYHQLWDRPAKSSLTHGHELVEKAQGLKPKTARERDYIQALAVFYQDADKIGHEKRAEAYSAAMEGVYKRHPTDSEAGVFYALSLLASGPERDPAMTNAKKAVAILNKLFEKQPDHPGIAHYIIHACDNPAMANLGLAAARKYAAIAPSSPHAVHMPSHIFARLGMWQDDINSNLAALQAADKMAAMHTNVMHHKIHSMDFLEYAYLQVGDDAKAKAIMDEVAGLSRSDVASDFQDYFTGAQTLFLAAYALERRQWKEALEIEPAVGAPPHVRAHAYWAHAIAAGHLHDAAQAQDALSQYDALLEAASKGPEPYTADSMKHDRDVLEAWADYAAGDNNEAVRRLRSVADEQDKIGKGETALPVREMLADMLLEMDRPQDALKEYETSLKTDPNRFNGLYGAARAAEAVHQQAKAAGYYTQLVKNCQSSGSDRPELERAKTLVAQN